MNQLCYETLLHVVLKVNAGIRDLLRGLDVLKAINNGCEGTIISCKLGMDFCHNSFGFGSSRRLPWAPLWTTKMLM
jgi:hypothetical protein